MAQNILLNILYFVNVFFYLLVLTPRQQVVYQRNVRKFENLSSKSIFSVAYYQNFHLLPLFSLTSKGPFDKE